MRKRIHKKITSIFKFKKKLTYALLSTGVGILTNFPFATGYVSEDTVTRSRLFQPLA